MASGLLEIALSCELFASWENVALNHGNIEVSIGTTFELLASVFHWTRKGKLRIQFASVCLAGFGMLPVVRCC